MSGDLVSAREAIVAAIEANVPSLRTCESHGGRFDRGELQRIGRKAPAVFVAALSVPGLEEMGGAVPANLRWGAYVITRDTPQAGRDVAVLDYTEALLRLVRDNRWGLDGAQKPTKVSADNLFSGKLDSSGIAMWAVTWDQQLHLTPKPISELADFELYHATHEVGGTDTQNAIDEVTLPQEDTQ